MGAFHSELDSILLKAEFEELPDDMLEQVGDRTSWDVQPIDICRQAPYHCAVEVQVQCCTELRRVSTPARSARGTGLCPSRRETLPLPNPAPSPTPPPTPRPQAKNDKTAMGLAVTTASDEFLEYRIHFRGFRMKKVGGREAPPCRMM